MFNSGCSKAVELSSFVLLLVLMPVLVPLSYECAVYFSIKYAHFILGSVKVAEYDMKLCAPSTNCYDMLCSLLKVFVFFQFVISAVKVF